MRPAGAAAANFTATSRAAPRTARAPATGALAAAGALPGPLAPAAGTAWGTA